MHDDESVPRTADSFLLDHRFCLHAIALVRWRAGCGRTAPVKSGCPGPIALSRCSDLDVADRWSLCIGTLSVSTTVTVVQAPRVRKRGAGAAAAADIRRPPST